jgi:ribonuclease HII
VGAAGVDEAGRGALCGPVVAAAVVLGREPPAGLDDSKRLSPGTRVRLAAEIRQMARGWGLGSATAAEIDEVNILNATFLAMRRALASLQEGLGSAPGLVLVDGPLAIR